MNELDFSFGDSPWEQLLSSRQPGESVSAAHLLALLEEEEEQAVEDAFQDLESMEIGLDVSDLPRVKAAGEATARLLREMELSKDGITPDQWEPDDPLRMYLEELAATPVYGEEGLLVAQAAQGDEQAKQNLACMGLSRVLEIAREFTGFGVLLLDLIQEGSLGLWQAVNRCDGSNYKNIRDFWIRFYMAKAVTLQARANGVGQKARRGLEDYKQVDERLLGELGRNPTLEEIAEQLHMELEEAESIRKMLDDARLLAQVKTPEEPEEEEQTQQQAVEDTAQFQSRARILDMLSGLDQKEAELLTLRFGLEGKPPVMPEEAGKRLGISPQAVLQMETAALAKLRNGQKNGTLSQ
ncbi:MAG TPA: sigma-70 family RNA polymerase sigma factor [Candidatus Faecousia intestinavium]|nr:sigma-70 family RNA polymerase sigma factor [Candidatus Faecousia intestinavium]